MSTWASYLATGPGPKKRFLVGGNWKCNGSVKQVGDLVSMLNAGGPIPLDVEVVVAPVSCHLSQAIAGLRSEVQVSAQNCADTAKVRFRAVVAKQSTLTPPLPPKKCGAFTGEIAAPILTDLGCTWTITGHSERRTLYGETSELVASKTAIALGAGLSVMVCIGERPVTTPATHPAAHSPPPPSSPPSGETLAERDGGKMFEVHLHSSYYAAVLLLVTHPNIFPSLRCSVDSCRLCWAS